VIKSGIADMINNGSTTSWLLSCHDTPRVATRYGLPLEKDRLAQQVARAWLLTDGATPRLDPALGERRARAAIMILLALPRSTYIYQGDELGLHEVADVPREALEDPMASRSTKERAVTDAECRCPGARTGRRTGSVHKLRTCPNRTGSGLTRLALRRLIHAPRLISTGARSPFVAACSQATTSIGSIPNRRCCTLHAAMAYGA
jgi:glycosidase